MHKNANKPVPTREHKFVFLFGERTQEVHIIDNINTELSCFLKHKQYDKVIVVVDDNLPKCLWKDLPANYFLPRKVVDIKKFDKMQSLLFVAAFCF